MNSLGRTYLHVATLLWIVEPDIVNIRPNIIYNYKLTAEILDQKVNALTTVYGKVNNGEKIVDKGDIITPEIFQKLTSLQENYEKQVGTNMSQWYVYGGIVIMISFATLLLIVIIKTFNPSRLGSCQ